MVPLLSLWLPILLTVVAVFVASSIIWMASPLHKHDYKSPGDKEGPIMDLVRNHAFEPGVYYVPWCGSHDGSKKKPTPEMMEKMKAGPWAMLTVMPGAPNMGKLLGAWALHIFIVTLLVAYIASISRMAGAGFMPVFQVATTAALLAHAGYALPMSIWHAQPWSQLPGRLVDGVIYAVITGSIFAGLWPAASATVA